MVKGVVLAGGNGTRLYPLTKVTNKHLLPVGEVPMLYHPITKLKEAGIEEILLITGQSDLGQIVSLLGNGKELGVDLTYRVQEEAGGIGHALSLAEGFVDQSRCCVLLADNIFEDSLNSFREQFEQQQEGAKVILKEVLNPWRYGIAELEEGRVISIEEKPTLPKSNYCVTGIYFYDAQVFDFIKQSRPSQRGEIEITDVNNCYIREGKLTYNVLKGWWIDAGTFPSLHRANQLVLGGKGNDRGC